MNDLSYHLHAQACNNAWSNLRLLRACAALDDAEFAAPRTGFFPSLKDTLNHIVTVDWLYVDALERAIAGRPVNPDAARFFEPLSPFATCAALAPAQREVDRRLIALCAGLTDLSPTVSIQRTDHVQREPLAFRSQPEMRAVGLNEPFMLEPFGQRQQHAIAEPEFPLQ